MREIKIINDDFDRYQLTINDGKLSDESIESIEILNRSEHKGSIPSNWIRYVFKNQMAQAKYISNR